LQASVFSEVKDGKAIDVYKRNLQKNYVEKMVDLLKPSSPSTSASASTGRGSLPQSAVSVSQSDVTSVVKAQLKDLNVMIKGAIPSVSGLSKYHLEDLSARIENALDPKN